MRAASHVVGAHGPLRVAASRAIAEDMATAGSVAEDMAAAAESVAEALQGSFRGPVCLLSGLVFSPIAPRRLHRGRGER